MTVKAISDENQQLIKYCKAQDVHMVGFGIEVMTSLALSAWVVSRISPHASLLVKGMGTIVGSFFALRWVTGWALGSDRAHEKCKQYQEVARAIEDDPKFVQFAKEHNALNRGSILKAHEVYLRMQHKKLDNLKN